MPKYSLQNTPNYPSLYTAVGVALTLVSSVHGVVAAYPLPATGRDGSPELAEGLGRRPYPSVGCAAPRLGHAPDGRGRPQPNAGRPLGRPILVGRGPPIGRAGRAIVGNEGKALRGAGGGETDAVEKGGKALRGTGAGDIDVETVGDALAKSSSSHGSSSLLPAAGAGVCTGRVDVEVASFEHGVLGYTGLEEIAVNAGALLGSNDSDAGTWMEELYGSG